MKLFREKLRAIVKATTSLFSNVSICQNTVVIFSVSANFHFFAPFHTTTRIHTFTLHDKMNYFPSCLKYAGAKDHPYFN